MKNMIRVILFFFLIFSALNGVGQNILTGDIAIIGVSVDNEEVLLVALDNIQAGETVFFTDEEWSGSSFNSGEGFYEWVTPSISVGTVISLTTSSSSVGGAITQRAGSFALGNSGDGVFLYQTSTNLYNTGSFNLISFAGEDAGDAGTLSGTGLTLGLNAIYFGGDNGIYNGTRTGNDKAGFLSLIYNSSNWQTSGSAQTFNTTNFSVITATAPTGVTTGTAGSISAASAVISGNDVGGDGGDAITERGVVYGTSANPTTADNKQVESGTTGSFIATLSGLNPSTTYYARAFATNSVGTTYGSDVSFTTNAPAGNTDSDIIENTGFSYSSNINYTTAVNSGPLTTGNSLELVQFTIRDGGAGNDADALTTTLTKLDLSITNQANLNRIAIFDGSTNVAEVAASSSISFSSLSLQAADDGTKDFSIRVSFNSTVTDNAQLVFSISSATAQAGASLFNAGDAGGASSSTTGDHNRIEVTATDLLFDQQPTNVNVGGTISPSPTVQAVDGNVNLDVDFTASVSLTTTGTFDGTATTSANAIGGVATFSNLIFSSASTNTTLTATATGVNQDVSASFDASVAPSVFIQQDFDGTTPEWTYSTDVATFDNNWGGDGYYGLIAFASASPLNYSGFSGNIFGENDLDDEGDNGTTGFATLTLDYVNIENYESVSLSFDWDVVGYNANADDAVYEVFHNQTGQGDVYLIDGGVSPTNGEGNVTVSIPNSVDSVKLEIRVRNNGGSGYSGFDNFQLEGIELIPDISLSDNGTQVSSGIVNQGAVDHILSKIQVASSTASATLNKLRVSTGGSYANADITNFKLRYSTDGNLDGADATLSTITTIPNSGDSLIFSGLSQSIADGATGYFFVTTDIDPSATASKTVSVGIPDLVFNSGNITANTISAGGTQTILAATPSVTLSSPNPAIASGTFAQGSENNEIYRFDLAVTTANAELTEANITLNGTYASSDISNLKLWYSSDNSFISASDELLQTIAAPGTTGIKNFSGFNKTVVNGDNGYFYVTVDIACDANTSNDLAVSAVTTSDLTFSSTVSSSGTANASGTHSFSATSPSDISNLSLTTASQSISVSWTNPAGCFDDVVIVVAEATNNDTPSSTSYTSDLDYTGSGATLGNGKVVYQGDSSPQTIIGLTNGTEYFVKIFSRNGTTWSSGIESSETPVNIVAPSNGNVFITEVSDAASFNNEFMEVFNPTADKIDLASTKIIRLSSAGTFEYAFDFSSDGVGDSEIEPYGFLILARGNSKTDFETEFGALPANTNFNEGNSNLFFGTGRRWQLKEGGTANTDDGTLIDDTQAGVADGDRVFQDISDNSFSSTSDADANPGLLGYSVASNNQWIGTEPTTTTNNIDLVIFSSLILSKDIFCDEIKFKSGKLSLGSNNLTVLGSVSGVSSSSYIQADGTGVLKQNIANGASKTFPVGTANYFTPITINQKGTADTLSIRVEEQVFANGTSGTVQTSDALDVSWVIEEKVEGGSRVDLTVQWPSSAELSGFDPTSCFFSHYRDGAWYPGATQDVSGSDPRSTTLSDVTSFSPFGVGSGSSPLPVELANFSAKRYQDGVLLNWSTISELNVEKFFILKTEDHQTKKIGSVYAEGNSNFINQYELLDYEVDEGTFSYELWEQDKNGNQEKIGITYIEKETSQVNVLREGNQLKLIGNNQEPITVSIFDVSGRLIQKMQLTTESIIDIEEFGIYFLQIETPYQVLVEKIAYFK